MDRVRFGRHEEGEEGQGPRSRAHCHMGYHPRGEEATDRAKDLPSRGSSYHTLAPATFPTIKATTVPLPWVLTAHSFKNKSVSSEGELSFQKESIPE